MKNKLMTISQKKKKIKVTKTIVISKSLEDIYKFPNKAQSNNELDLALVKATKHSRTTHNADCTQIHPDERKNAQTSGQHCPDTKLDKDTTGNYRSTAP